MERRGLYHPSGPLRSGPSVAHYLSEPSGRGKGNTKRPFPVPSFLPAKRPYISPARTRAQQFMSGGADRASKQGKLTRKGPLVTSARSLFGRFFFWLERAPLTPSLTHVVEQNVGVPGLQLEAGEAAGAVKSRNVSLGWVFGRVQLCLIAEGSRPKPGM